MEQPLPWIPIPFLLVYLAAYICEWLHLWLGGFDPLFTRNEIMKVTNSHYCKLDKAIEELGYEPKKYRVSLKLELKVCSFSDKQKLCSNVASVCRRRRNFDERACS